MPYVSHDGEPIWDHFQAFPDGDLENVSLEEYKDKVDEKMKKNAWKVCEEVVTRVDDAPGPGQKDYIKAFQTPEKNKMFFWDKQYLLDYIHKPKSQKSAAPGHGYYSKIEKFMSDHFEIGELYIEYIRYGCDDPDECEFCGKGWTGSPLVRCPKPYPDADRLPEFHYRHADQTPIIL